MCQCVWVPVSQQDILNLKILKAISKCIPGEVPEYEILKRFPDPWTLESCIQKSIKWNSMRVFGSQILNKFPGWFLNIQADSWISNYIKASKYRSKFLNPKCFLTNPWISKDRSLFYLKTDYNFSLWIGSLTSKQKWGNTISFVLIKNIRVFLIL